jgi:hypothetical protein
MRGGRVVPCIDRGDSRSLGTGNVGGEAPTCATQGWSWSACRVSDKQYSGPSWNHSTARAIIKWVLGPRWGDQIGDEEHQLFTRTMLSTDLGCRSAWSHGRDGLRLGRKRIDAAGGGGNGQSNAAERLQTETGHELSPRTREESCTIGRHSLLPPSIFDGRLAAAVPCS